MEAIEALNFQPSMVGQTLSRRESRSILAVFPLQVRQNLSDYLYGINRVLSVAGYDLLISFTDESIMFQDAESPFSHKAGSEPQKDHSFDYEKYLSRGLVGGCIYLSTIRHTPDNKLDFGKIPTVFVSEYLNAPYDYCVVSDIEQSVYELTSRLIARGRRRFAYIHACYPGSGVPVIYSEARFQGMLHALNDHGIPYHEELTRYSSMHNFAENAPDPGYLNALPCASSYLQLPRDQWPDVIICAYDSFALACSHVLHEARIKVPGEIAIVGFDNSAATTYASPQLTSVQSPCSEFGYEAAKLLVRIMQGEVTTPQQIQVTAKIIERGSTLEGVD